MPKNENTKWKSLYIVRILEEMTDSEHDLSGAEIREILSRDYGIEVSRKTLAQDMEELADLYDCGILQGELEIVRSRANRYRLLSHDFETRELKLLVDAVQSSRFITEEESRRLTDKLLCRFAGRHEREQMRRQLYVCDRVRTPNKSVLNNIDHIHQAIKDKKQIAFRYVEWTPDKERVPRHEGKLYQISPHSLVWDSEYYYLVGYDGEAEAVKHYRVDKMIGVRGTDAPAEGAERVKAEDPGTYSRRLFGMFRGQTESVSLKCHNSLAGVVLDRFGTDVMMTRRGEEHFTATVRVSVSDNFLAWVIGFGKRMRVTEPAWVRERVIALATDAALDDREK